MRIRGNSFCVLRGVASWWSECEENGGGTKGVG